MKPKSCIYMNDVGCVIKVDQTDGCPCERGRRETRHEFQRRLRNALCKNELTIEQFRDAVEAMERELVNGE